MADLSNAEPSEHAARPEWLTDASREQMERFRATQGAQVLTIPLSRVCPQRFP